MTGCPDAWDRDSSFEFAFPVASRKNWRFCNQLTYDEADPEFPWRGLWPKEEQPTLSCWRHFIRLMEHTGVSTDLCGGTGVAYGTELLECAWEKLWQRAHESWYQVAAAPEKSQVWRQCWKRYQRNALKREIEDRRWEIRNQRFLREAEKRSEAAQRFEKAGRLRRMRRKVLQINPFNIINAVNTLTKHDNTSNIH